MQQTASKSIGTLLSQTGLGKQPMTEKSGQSHEQSKAGAVCLRNGASSLPSKQENPQADRAIAMVIRGPISAMTTLHLMGADEREAALEFWIKSLRPYPPSWISDAFEYFARNGGATYPSPQRIIEIINRRRGGPNA